MRHTDRVKLLAVFVFSLSVITIIISGTFGGETSLAFSSGPPAGHTGAPSEFNCNECHLVEAAGTGRFTVTGPSTYTPGRTYQFTVQHTTSDQTRVRWGFQVTALTQENLKAGEFTPINNQTQIATGGPDTRNPRQYIEQTAAGNFFNQRGGATWTFNWTAPASDVGPVTFYAAGNQANGDGNTSGDFIYTTFVSAQPSSVVADISVTASPSPLTVAPGNNAFYNLQTTPSGGFAGDVNFSVAGLPAEAFASFNPPKITFNNPFPINSTLSIGTAANVPPGTYPLVITAIGQGVQRQTQVPFVVTGTPAVDLTLALSGSPNPAVVNTNLSYRITVKNNGPSPASNVTVRDALPATLALVSVTPGQGSCSGTTELNCNLGNLARGASTTIALTVRPTATGQVSNTAAVTSAEADHNPANNSVTATSAVDAQGTAPVMLDSNLGVRTLVSGLEQPTGVAFLGANDLLVIERASGKVRRVTGGQIQPTLALDLNVNSASERGLLGITLHPNFATNKFVYLFWTESNTGADSGNLDETTTLGNRVDQYLWNGSTLSFQKNVIRLRAFQADAGQPLRGNHNGGRISFGPDGKLYAMIGDNGRRGLLQNLANGASGVANVPDDQFGGPAPDDAHLTGVVLRLNDDGTAPADNPFYSAGAAMGGEAGANVQKIFGYGVRNGFGMAFDPLSGRLWLQENGDDSFDELNLVEAGYNGGWTQLMGPSSRIAQYKEIETARAGGLQQIRWPASRIADTAAEALARLYQLPGSRYTEPEFSWRYAVAPSPIGFVRGKSLGAAYEGDMIVGASRPTLYGGFLFRMKLNNDRRAFAFNDSRLNDKVADNLDKFDAGESESLLVGRDFGVTTDIQTAPNGNLYVVSLSGGAIYEVYSTAKFFVAKLDGGQVVPSSYSPALGTATIQLSADETSAKVSLHFAGLSSAQVAAHLHGPAAAGANGGLFANVPNGKVVDHQISLTAAEVQSLRDGQMYIDVHSGAFPEGEMRGQFFGAAGTSAVQIEAMNYRAAENVGGVTINVARLGDATRAANITYTTSDDAGVVNCAVMSGKASARCDYTAMSGAINFAAGETRKTITVPVVDDAHVEGAESFFVALASPHFAGADLGAVARIAVTIEDNDTAVSPTNVIDSPAFFVREHYLDFLNREPDAGGYDAWLETLTKCRPSLPTCDRVHVSAAFFRSDEFQDRGYFLYRFYAVALGRLPRYAEFVNDLRAVTGNLPPPQMEAAKTTFVDEFVGRAEFKLKFDQMSQAQFVDALLVAAGGGVTLAERNQLVGDLQTGAKTRARALRDVAESKTVVDKFYDESFVVMQYFGYLRRDPDPLYVDWIRTIKATKDYRVMVGGFINSVEYRTRFGQP